MKTSQKAKESKLEKITLRRGTKTYGEVIKAMKVLKEELDKMSLHPRPQDDLRVL